MIVQSNQESTAAALSWRIREQPGFTTVEFLGAIDEKAEFAQLRSGLEGHVVFHLAGVRRINSFGVREWVNFVRDLPGVTELTLTHCSPAIVAQLNMIYSFRGKARVRSFYAPYACSRCEREEEKLFHSENDFPKGDFTRMPTVDCACGGRLEFDDVVERYLGFLREQASSR